MHSFVIRNYELKKAAQILYSLVFLFCARPAAVAPLACTVCSTRVLCTKCEANRSFLLHNPTKLVINNNILFTMSCFALIFVVSLCLTIS